MFFESAARLAQRLQAASSEQTASHLSADIVALLDHCEKIKLHSEQQAASARSVTRVFLGNLAGE